MDKPVRKAVRCFVIDGDKVLVIKYKSPHVMAGWYDIPGGKIEEGETPTQTAVREVREETALDISKLKRKGNLVVEYPERIFDFEVFCAEEFSGAPKDLTENSSEWIAISELLSKDNIFSCTQLLNNKYINLLKNEGSDFRMHIYVNSDESIQKIELNGVEMRAEEWPS